MGLKKLYSFYWISLRISQLSGKAVVSFGTPTLNIHKYKKIENRKNQKIRKTGKSIQK